MLDAAFLAGKLDMLPDPMTVTVVPFNSATSEMTVTGARWRQLNRREIDWAASIGLGLSARVWLLSAGNLTPTNYQVVQNDILVDDTSQKWNIRDASLEMQGTIWRCVSVRAPT